MESTSGRIKRHLEPLIGLQLIIARRGADMRIFHFGPVQKVEGGTVGSYALHIQCPWRIEGPIRIVTGRSDLWEPDTDKHVKDRDLYLDYANGNLQDKIIGSLLGIYDPVTRSYMNRSDGLIVEKIHADRFGGATISLSGGYRLVLFPAGSAESEDWRIFRPDTEEPHFVVSGGKIE